jgi:ABC-2 type transport system ATP-binding protein
MSMRVLIVEDEPKMASLIRRGLLEEGHEADHADSSEDALSLAAATSYDAIILDLMLPDHDGITLCRMLRTSGIHAPVVMLTARERDEDRDDALESGASAYLTKPFAFGELLARLDELARRGPLEPPVPGHPARGLVKATVDADGLGKDYGSVVAVDDLSFEAEAGEILGVLGPNGAGKTTAIRVLTTILAPTRGTFSVAAQPHTRPDAIRSRIGVLPESAGYPEQQTGEEYLRFFARLYGHSRASARAVARTLLEEVGLSDRGGALIGSYSRGMRQRVGIARALVNEPQVIFLDEPTLGLDPAGQRQILTSVRRVAAERGVTVLLCTHLLTEVEETCSRVLILNRGRVAALGTVAEVARLAAAPRSGRFRVGFEDLERARTALAAAPGVERIAAEGSTGWLTAVLETTSGRPDETLLNEGLRALLDEGIPVLSLELEGARLSDAFLAMTETARA